MSTYGLPAPIKPQPWQVDALCAQVDPELWFPDGSAPHSSQPTQDAIAMCHRCPVIADCRAFAMAAEASKHWKNRYGIYGGLLPIERYSIYVQSRERECAECRIECGWGPTEGDPTCDCDRYEPKEGQGR